MRASSASSSEISSPDRSYVTLWIVPLNAKGGSYPSAAGAP
jgi:hypothetical protein